MLPLLLLFGVATPVPLTIEPHDNSTLCQEILVELNEGVTIGLLTDDQAAVIYHRCVWKYSLGNY